MSIDTKKDGADDSEEDSSIEALSNPIYFTDEHLNISEEDQATVTAANQQKQSGSENVG